MDRAPAVGRLLGTETEYAIRFRPDEGVAHPGNQVLFEAIRAAVERRVLTRPCSNLLEAVLTENGGCLYYEFDASAPDGGLVEGGTPECVAPRQLLVYQKAQDQLLTEATRDAESELRDRGLAGELRLLKNCRDAQGHVYGAQESYEVELASGVSLLAWWVAMGGLAAASVALTAVLWLVQLLVHGLFATALLAGVLAVAAVLLVTRMPTTTLGRYLQRAGRALDVIDRLEARVMGVAFAPVVALASLAVRLFAFRPHHQGATAFLASRCVFTGAGTLMPDDGFGLSEKGPAMRRLWRWTMSPDDRGLYEIGHLFKPLLPSFRARFGGLRLPRMDLDGIRGLFRRRLRLQIGLSDANLCEVAEYLKVATTSLVLDLAEAGQLHGAPELADPVAATQVIGGDPTLRAWVPLEHSGNMTGLEVQRWYQERAREWVEQAEVRDLEAWRVVTLWGEVLDTLEAHPEALFGRVDWITKLHLISSAGDLAWAARKKIDLRYHELGTGYFAWLDEAGACQRLIEPSEVVVACRTPPPGSPAEERGRLVRQLAMHDEPAAPPIAIEREEEAEAGRVIDFAEAARRRRNPPPEE
ncbi:MAG: proteasome accessory factor PafA2 family protein [Alphaproteobacteria bacterium]|nr:proteasome accessory factor PafA2 family protein [Alphaproteobacteria bacterium]MCB9695302.1 proteasome accessory factor PafA2 family protein [Alphaproteobacteria bacterium]